jgi:2-isopropylmalate synthase
MALKVRHDHYNINTNIDTSQIYRTSRMVSSLTGMQVQRNKAIVGANAFAHEAGIHQHGVLAEASTYEIMRPEDVGVPKTALVLGKHSGRHAYQQRISDLGYVLSDQQLTDAVESLKTLADKKKEIFSEDIEAVVEDLLDSVFAGWKLQALQISSGSNMIPTATISLRNPAGELFEDAGTGDGPIDAVYSAIARITGITAKLAEYSIRAITGGKEAQGEVYIKLRCNDASYRGRAFSTDIIEASALAYLQAINRIITANGIKN